jgi:hypothetical protein
VHLCAAKNGLKLIYRWKMTLFSKAQGGMDQQELEGIGFLVLFQQC